jgi:hypothetical protein
MKSTALLQLPYGFVPLEDILRRLDLVACDQNQFAIQIALPLCILSFDQTYYEKL